MLSNRIFFFFTEKVKFYASLFPTCSLFQLYWNIAVVLEIGFAFQVLTHFSQRSVNSKITSLTKFCDYVSVTSLVC